MLLPLVPALVVKGLFWVLALTVFLRLLARQQDGVIDAHGRRLLGAVVLGVLAGSKLAYAIGYPDLVVDVSEADHAWFLAWLGGDSAPGAVVGGRVGLWIADRGVRSTRLADALVPPVGAALLILCLGAFFWALRGADYGGPTGLPWGVDFGDGVARHPVMLYEALALAIVLARDRRFASAATGAGERARQFLLVYCAAGLALGYLKGPFHRMLLPEAAAQQPRIYASLMTAEQCLCATTILVVLAAMWMSRVRSSLTPAE